MRLPPVLDREQKVVVQSLEIGDWGCFGPSRLVPRTISGLGHPIEIPLVPCSLERPVPELTFDEVPLKEVIDFLNDVSIGTVSVNWDAIESAGIARDRPVSCR